MKLIASLKQHIANNHFMKSISILVAGTATSNLFLLLTTPIVTHLYSPEQYGVFSLYLSILYSVSVIASLMYDQAVPLPKDDQEGWDTLVLSLLIAVLMSGAVFVLTLVLPFGIWMNAPELDRYGWLLVFSILGIGSYQAFNAWSIRTEDYPSISRSKVSMNSGQTVSQIALGVAHTGVAGLLVGEIIGRISGFMTFIYFLIKKKPEVHFFHWEGIKKMLIRYKNFPLWSSWSALINVTGTQIPAIFLAAHYGPAVAGWYLLADKILTVPDALLGYSVKQVYMSQSAKLSAKGEEFVSLFWNTVKKMTLISCIVIGSAALVVPVIIPVVFGESWRESGIFLQMISILYVMKMVVNPIAANFYVLETQTLQMVSEVLRFALIGLSVVLVVFYIDNPAMGVLCISLLSSLGYFVNGFFAWYAMNTRFANGSKRLSAKETG